ncbi:uncharacterized protein TRUGW13939_09472 [Talaromyces rugulosus]|uniref:Uncharacterized protein n=1 Tax=Talaromyces rugulosus TaxID=121627 RepID=A0A7H8RCN1_TALRU|nr:uncharacterized protein TRUGW13939_09472 [Talaromyces rugulosus]QKX62313.1 hypothetical protein TRUGW13939_09472 [Talaromyces rugulosus]
MASLTKQPKPVLYDDHSLEILRAQKGTAAISMSVMWLTATTVLALVNSNNLTVINPSGQEVASTAAVVIFGVTPFVWAGSFLTWTLNLGDISCARRNNSLLGGTVVPSIVLMYIILAVPEPSFREYVWYTFWPTHAGLGLGALL